VKYAFLVWMSLAIIGLVGWVKNLIKLIGLFGEDVTAELAIRLVGVIVAPLGAVAGYF
jgi:hypothetical protein